MRTIRGRVVMALVVLAVVAGSCGGEREPETATSEPAPTTTAAISTSAASGDTSATTTATPVPTFGDLEWPCGPGDASGATDQGVTDDTIVIGLGDDRGAAVSPGLNKPMTDGVMAMVERCNELGGINGRTIEPVLYDAALFNVASVMLQACDQVFMLVGTGFGLDNLGEETRQGCGLAAVPSYTVSADAAMAPGVAVGVPSPADQYPLSAGVMMADRFPAEITRTGVLKGNFAPTRSAAEWVTSSFPALGYEFVADLEYNVSGEADWNPFIVELADAGAEIVYFVGSCLPNYQGVRRAAAQQGFEAIWIVDANFYEEPCAAANTDGAMDDTYIRMVTIPFEEADANPATRDFVDVVDASGGELALLGAQGASSFLLWAQAARDCGSELTRDCVVAGVNAVHEWTAGGLHVPTDPGDNLAPTCGLLIRLEGTEYERVRPEEPGNYECDDTWRAENLVTSSVIDAQLDDNRESAKYTG